MPDNREDEIIKADFRQDDTLILKLSCSQEAWLERLNANGHATLVAWYLPHKEGSDSYSNTTRACLVISTEKAIKDRDAQLAKWEEERKQKKKGD